MVAGTFTVVQLLPDLDEGGVENETLELGSYLAAHGYRSIVISAGGRLVPQLEKAGSEHLTWPHIGEKSPRCLQYIRRLRNLLLTQKVDILHLRSRLPAWIGYLAWKSLPKSKRPGLITSFHGFYSVNRYSTIMTKGEKVIAVSNNIRDHILENYPIGSWKIHVIHGGFDAHTFNPDKVEFSRLATLREQWDLHGQDPVIILPGRLSAWKGQDIFISALNKIRHLPFTALCVGDLSENTSFAQKLNAKIKQYDLQDRIKLVGHCSDMPAAMMLSDIVVSASSSQPEAFGKVAIEAMAMGKPVIATRHGGSLETVQDGISGWLVEPSDPGDMARALEDALCNKEKLHTMGKNGQQRVNKLFTSCTMCVKTVDLYHSLLLEKSGTETNEGRLTVLQMLPELEGGGVERGTLEMGRYLTEKGHNSLVISSGGRMVEQLVREKSRHINWKVGAKSPRSLSYILPLRKLLLREKVDILHLRSRMPAWIGYLAWKSLPKKKRPALVTTFHGFYSINGYSAIMTKGQKIIAVSEAIAQHIRENYHQENKLVLIYRGIDQRLFCPDNVSGQRIETLNRLWNLDPAIPTIMLPGRLTRLKGQHIFIKSLSSLSDLAFQAILVGDTEDNPGYTKELDSIVATLGLNDKVKFVGHCQDMPAALLLSDIVVSATSTEPEAFGRTTAEAMAMGKPVIATAHGGSLETVIDGETGWLVPPSDPEAMGRALREALSDKNRRELYGQKGKERVQNYFTLQTMCDKTLYTYQQLLAENKKSKR
ncbi:MAG: glycosyltransferase family 4 protein [Desulfobulbaceae bacterium]|nr:glycosyltransferase family 4 protein [Desulfobulbaceae bacterium]